MMCAIFGSIDRNDYKIRQVNTKVNKLISSNKYCCIVTTMAFMGYILLDMKVQSQQCDIRKFRKELEEIKNSKGD